MGYKMRAECEACGYQADSLFIGDGQRTIARCDSCARVVNAPYDRYRPFDQPRCPDCQRELSGLELFFSSQSGPHYLCPACKEPSLHLLRQAHFSQRPAPLEPGRMVQARTLNERTAALHGLWELDGSAPPWHWIEAEVLEGRKLRFVSTIRPWRINLFDWMTVQIAEDEPVLRFHLRPLLDGLAGEEVHRFFSRLSFLTEPTEGSLEQDEAGRCLRLKLSREGREIADYFETLDYVLQEEFEGEGGPPDWQPVKLKVVEEESCSLLSLQGAVLTRIAFET